MSIAGIYGKVADQSAKNENATVIKEIGEFYAIVEQTKLVQGEKGTFAIVESKVASVFDGLYTPSTLVCHMQSKGKHTMMEDLIASYVAAFNLVSKGHKFFENETENAKKWIELSEQVFGKAVANPETQKFEFVHDNPMKGVVVHYKVKPQLGFDKDANGKRTVPRLDANGKQIVYPNILMLGVKTPEELGPEFIAKWSNELHPGYTKKA